MITTGSKTSMGSESEEEEEHAIGLTNLDVLSLTQEFRIHVSKHIEIKCAN